MQSLLAIITPMMGSVLTGADSQIRSRAPTRQRLSPSYLYQQRGLWFLAGTAFRGLQFLGSGSCLSWGQFSGRLGPSVEKGADSWN